MQRRLALALPRRNTRRTPQRQATGRYAGGRKYSCETPSRGCLPGRQRRRAPPDSLSLAYVRRCRPRLQPCFCNVARNATPSSSWNAGPRFLFFFRGAPAAGVTFFLPRTTARSLKTSGPLSRSVPLSKSDSPHHPVLKTCHSDRRDGGFGRPGAEKSLLVFGSQAQFSPPPQMELRSFAHVPRRAHREDALVALHHQQPFQHPATLIVQEILEPSVFHEFGYDHDDVAIGMLL